MHICWPPVAGHQHIPGRKDLFRRCRWFFCFRPARDLSANFVRPLGLFLSAGVPCPLSDRLYTISLRPTLQPSPRRASCSLLANLNSVFQRWTACCGLCRLPCRPRFDLRRRHPCGIGKDLLRDHTCASRPARLIYMTTFGCSTGLAERPVVLPHIRLLCDLQSASFIGSMPFQPGRAASLSSEQGGQRTFTA